jgi:hypothetical protein
MTTNEANHESWVLELIFCVLVGVPWYFFSASVWGSLAVHIGLAVAYLAIVVGVFGRGSAVMSFLLIFVFSVLAGIVLIGLNQGRLFQ